MKYLKLFEDMDINSLYNVVDKSFKSISDVYGLDSGDIDHSFKIIKTDRGILVALYLSDRYDINNFNSDIHNICDGLLMSDIICKFVKNREIWYKKDINTIYTWEILIKK